MGIQKQSFMVQSILTSGVCSELDPSIISAVVKGISETRSLIISKEEICKMTGVIFSERGRV